MNAADEASAGFWPPIEAAVETLMTASLRRLPAVLIELVALLSGEVIPRLSAEEKILLPLVSSGSDSVRSIGLNRNDVSRLTETLSILSLRPTGSETGRIRATASTLLTVLKAQRQAENILIARIRALPAADRCAETLGDRLEEEAQTSLASQIFVSEADRLPTEAWALRHNPKPTRIGHVAQGGKSPVADLVAALEATGQFGAGPQGKAFIGRKGSSTT